jgi:Uma2 family endonuclease
MSVATAERPMSLEEFLAIPDDDNTERALIQGKLWEWKGMTKRNRTHSRSMVRIGTLLTHWLDTQPEPRGEVAGGEVGAIIRTVPVTTTVGIDVAYFGPEVVGISTGASTLYEGPPVLAVEILSPSNTQQEVMLKVREYLDCGVPLIWVVEPTFQTVTVYRPDAEPELFNNTQTLNGEPHLPGFSCPVAAFFR